MFFRYCCQYIKNERKIPSMKKFTSLLLSLLLCLCMLPGMAEEAAEPAAEAAFPAISLPISFETYSAAYEAVIAANTSSATITWQAVEKDGRSIRMAVVNDAFVSLMVLLEDDMVTELAVVLQAGLDEENLISFLSMCGYCGAALLEGQGMDAAEASETCMADLYDFFSAMSQGQQVESVFGLPGGMSISSPDNTTWQYYFALKLVAE